MVTDPRDALNRLIAAFEHHFDVAQAGSQMDATALSQAEDRLQDAFFTYDDVLFTRFGVELPFDILDEEDDDDDVADDDGIQLVDDDVIIPLDDDDDDDDLEGLEVIDVDEDEEDED